jgi:hypothetical protein
MLGAGDPAGGVAMRKEVPRQRRPRSGGSGEAHSVHRCRAVVKRTTTGRGVHLPQKKDDAVRK